ncbi:MAG: sulfurtransferase complex subunit TusC [Pseudomonadota bacterium]|jgi:tRNA 2-thiouridine synthesizing protein C|nr:sulfurtransferase complex subunit TusC [Pseudomonadota bacterium]
MNAPEVLIICRRAPYASSAARDAIDVALSCALFALPVTLLLLDDAVLQLLPDQQSGGIGQKNPNAMLGVLPMYDIDRLYTSTQSLALHGLEDVRLDPAPIVLDQAEIRALLARHPRVIML